jgi:hypothetical protein
MLKKSQKIKLLYVTLQNSSIPATNYMYITIKLDADIDFVSLEGSQNTKL